MSLIRRLSCDPEHSSPALHHQHSARDSSAVSPFGQAFSNLSNTHCSDLSMLGIMGCSSLLEPRDLVKKYSFPEELLNDRFIPIRKSSSLKMDCEDEEAENNENNEGVQKDGSPLSIPRLYKKHVLSIRSDEMEPGLDAFRNNNILKFRHTQSNREASYMSKNSACLDINEEISESRGSNNRKIPRLPAKVLDAPALQDDFYLNLIDWS